MKAAVFTLGCKVNEVESSCIAASLESMGFSVTDALCPADIFVLNTCAVTREAEKKEPPAHSPRKKIQSTRTDFRLRLRVGKG